MPNKCSKCNRLCLFKKKCPDIQVFGCPCDCCRKVICKECSKMTATEVRAVLLANRVTYFFCDSCNEAIKSLPLMKTNVIQAELDIEDLKKSSTTTVSMLDELKNDVAVLKADIEGLKTASSDTISYADVVSNLNIETKTLRTYIQEIETRFNQASVHPPMKDQSGSVELTLTEIQDRELRACNVLMFGADELKSTSTDERKVHYMDIVANTSVRA
nr:unnamed protein product [Callosobruchus analis]